MPKLPNAAGAFLGFDCADYPGNAFMQDWWDNSPYQLAGYYLQAPCHQGFVPWSGSRMALVGIGWNLLVIYVGQQRAGGPCGQNTLTNAQGVADAIEAAQLTTNEGFAVGTYIYLDLETGNAFDNDLADYLSGWIPQILASGFGPGVYCSRNIAADVQASALAQYPAGVVAPPCRFWVFGDNNNRQFNRDTSLPSDSGVPFADAWQSLTSILTWGASTKSVNKTVSRLADPSAP